MRQVIENLRNGEIHVVDVPIPRIRDGHVLVRNEYSAISTGTESGTVKLGRMGLLAKARARPDQAAQVVRLALDQGPVTAYSVAQRALDAPILLGYSSAGRVVEVGAGVDGLRVDDAVACAGQNYASHAEYVLVPKNLVAKIPDGVGMRDASFATIGAIAVQSMRVAEVELGENVAVVGLGLVGTLLVQLLGAAGCRVLGLDIDPRRCEFVQSMGWAEVGTIGVDEIVSLAGSFSRGQGMDAVIVTASSDSSDPVELAGELCRRKGRVVVVGRTLMHAPRETFLFKELELRTSMAYGPGTGDPNYELKGHDYPLAYVRWTEQRNLVAFLDQVATGRVALDGLAAQEYDVGDAPEAFNAILSSAEPTYGVVIAYPNQNAGAEEDTVALRSHAAGKRAAMRVGVIGAGNFAGNEIMPLIAKCSVDVEAVVSSTGIRAQSLGVKYGARYCAAHADPVLDDPNINAIIILTRHNTHASLATSAFQKGKHVFVEKPLALSVAELDQVEEAWRHSGLALMVGFNRRYAPLARRLKSVFGKRSEPLSVVYRVNVGHRLPEHWLHDPVEGGGVLLGEASHHIDFCSWLCQSPIAAIRAVGLGGPGGRYLPEDTFQLTLHLTDGSLAVIVYSSVGSRSFPSEVCDVTGQGLSASLVDFRRLSWSAGWRQRTQRNWFSTDRGHAAQMRDFFGPYVAKPDAAIIQSYFDSSRWALEANAQLVAGMRTAVPG